MRVEVLNLFRRAAECLLLLLARSMHNRPPQRGDSRRAPKAFSRPGQPRGFPFGITHGAPPQA